MHPSHIRDRCFFSRNSLQSELCKSIFVYKYRFSLKRIFFIFSAPWRHICIYIYIHIHCCWLIVDYTQKHGRDWIWIFLSTQCMMTSSNGNIFCVTGPLWRESTGHRWIPHTKASDAELRSFLWSAPDQTIEQTFDRGSGDLRRHRVHYDVTVMGREHFVCHPRSCLFKLQGGKLWWYFMK